MAPVSEAQLKAWGATIQDGEAPVVERARAMWELRHSKEHLAVQLLIKYVKDIVPPMAGANALLQHEAAYCLGQMGDPAGVDALDHVIHNEKQEAIVRHEAGEGLAALANNPAVDKERIKHILSEFLNSPIVPVKETCEIGVERVKWLSTPAAKNLGKLAKLAETTYPGIVDPSPAFHDTENKSIAELREFLLGPKSTLFERYQALFSLRDASLESPISDEKMSEIIKALMDCLAAPLSALLRHEVAFILGQMNIAKTGAALLHTLQSAQEHPMVRHESALSLGDVVCAAEAAAGDHNKLAALGVSADFIAAAKKALTDGMKDNEQLVRDSCALGLELANKGITDGRFRYN